MIKISDYQLNDFSVLIIITKQYDLNLKFPCLSGYDLVIPAHKRLIIKLNHMASRVYENQL